MHLLIFLCEGGGGLRPITKETPVPDRFILSVKDERISFTRGTTLIHGMTVPFAEYLYIPGN